MKKYIPELDGLRAIALILVLLFHFGLIEFGLIGFQLFFVLSGFLISNILITERNKQLPIKDKMKTFYLRRVLRIFPVYYLYLIIALAVLYFFPVYLQDYLNRAVSLFSYTYNFTKLLPDWKINPLLTHLWSMSVEEQFYLFFPLIVFVTSNKTLKNLVVLAILLAPIFRYFAYQYIAAHPTNDQDAAGIMFWLSPSHFDALMLGAFINLFNLTRWKYRNYGLAIALIVTLAAGFFSYWQTETTINWQYLLNLGYTLNKTDNYQYVWSLSLLNILFAFLITVIVANTDNSKSLINRLFRLKPLVAIGKISYGMYIFHWLILSLFNMYFLKIPGIPYIPVLLFIIYLAFVYLAGVISYRFFEIRFLKLKPKYTDK